MLFLLHSGLASLCPPCLPQGTDIIAGDPNTLLFACLPRVFDVDSNREISDGWKVDSKPTKNQEKMGETYIAILKGRIVFFGWRHGNKGQMKTKKLRIFKG